MKILVLIPLIIIIFLLVGCTQSPQKTPKDDETLHVSLGEEFTLHKTQSAIIEDEDFEIKITQFFNSPCPEGSQCVWSGVGIGFEYYHDGEVKKGVNLVQAFGYQTTILETDYETFAKLKITKIESGDELSPSVPSCINEFNVKNLKPDKDFVSEQVLVGFVDGITKIEAKDIINSYNLEIQSWSPPDFTYGKIKVLRGNRENYIPILEDHPRIGSVKLVDDSSDELLIYFYIPDFKNLKLEEVESIINEFDNIKLVHDEIYEKFIKINFAVIKVPKNFEFKWICKLQEDPDVRYAELNRIVTIS